MFQIVSSKDGHCPLCVGKDAEKDKPLFVVEGPGYTGEICSPHLHVLVKQSKPAETLFTK